MEYLPATVRRRVSRFCCECQVNCSTLSPSPFHWWDEFAKHFTNTMKGRERMTGDGLNVANGGSQQPQRWAFPRRPHLGPDELKTFPSFLRLDKSRLGREKISSYKG